MICYSIKNGREVVFSGVTKDLHHIEQVVRRQAKVGYSRPLCEYMRENPHVMFNCEFTGTKEECIAYHKTFKKIVGDGLRIGPLSFRGLGKPKSIASLSEVPSEQDVDGNVEAITSSEEESPVAYSDAEETVLTESIVCADNYHYPTSDEVLKGLGVNACDEEDEEEYHDLSHAGFNLLTKVEEFDGFYTDSISNDTIESSELVLKAGMNLVEGVADVLLNSNFEREKSYGALLKAVISNSRC